MSKKRLVSGSIFKSSTGLTVIEVKDGNFTAAAAEKNNWDGVEKGISEHAYKAAKEEKKDEEEVYVNGHFYNNDGTFEGKVDKKGNKGSINDVYTCTGKEKKKNKEGVEIEIFKETEILKEGETNTTHSNFCYIGYIIKMEAGNADLKELKCIAYTSHNRAKAKSVTWRQILATTYSSVPNKTEMLENSKDEKSKLTRQALFSVLKEETDITKGAEFWDGTDFLAWGNSETNPYNRVGQNKFNEYKFIEIPKDVYDDFVKANGNSVHYGDKGKHPEKGDKGTHEHIKKKVPIKGKDGKLLLDKDGKPTFKEEADKIKYQIPAADFKDVDYWVSGSFYYDTGVKTTNGLSGTITAGKSIFWKPTSKRLTPDTPVKIK